MVILKNKNLHNNDDMGKICDILNSKTQDLISLFSDKILNLLEQLKKDKAFFDIEKAKLKTLQLKLHSCFKLLNYRQKLLSEETDSLEKERLALKQEHHRLEKLKIESQIQETKLKKIKPHLTILKNIHLNLRSCKDEENVSLGHYKSSKPSVFNEINKNLCSKEENKLREMETELAMKLKIYESKNAKLEETQAKLESLIDNYKLNEKRFKEREKFQRFSKQELYISQEEKNEVPKNLELSQNYRFKDLSDTQEQLALEREALELEKETFNQERIQFEKHKEKIISTLSLRERSLASLTNKIYDEYKEMQRQQNLVATRLAEESKQLKHKPLTISISK